MLPIIGMFAVTVIYALGLRSETVRTIFLYASLAYPVLIAFIIALSLPRSVSYQVDSTGVHITFLGMIHKRIHWSDVGSMGPVQVGNVESIGVMYIGAFTSHVFGRKARQRMWGWDEVLANARAENGASFAEEITRQYKKHLRVTNRGIAE